MELQRPPQQQQQQQHLHHSPQQQQPPQPQQPDQQHHLHHRHLSTTSSYQEHDPAHLILPAVPNHDLSTPAPKNIQLPCLRDLFSPELEQVIHRREASGTTTTITTAAASPMTLSSPPGSITPSDAEHMSRGRPTSLMMVEDPAVRIAAEALSGLGNPGFVRSPTRQSFHQSPSQQSFMDDLKIEHIDDPEPLLRLFAQAHPWVAGTINGSVFAYNTTKNLSPGFIQHGANYVERNIAAPVVNTVGTVGRFTGVEDGLRKYLGGRRASELNNSERLSAKALAATATSAPSEDVDMGGCEDDNMRRDSADTLPAYRASKPPSYREEVSPAVADRARAEGSTGRSWPSQVAGQMFVMTSGLGIALSVTSRRSLQYCLSLLGQAIEHVATVTNALRMVLEQYDEARVSWRRQHEAQLEKNGRCQTPEQDEASRRLAELIKRHCEDIWHTLKTVVNSVSSITGGALPENARHFVRTQLMSLPQRWRLVSEQHTGESETSRMAHRMIAFATEGLDMMSQVSQVVQATLESAERWLDRVGRRDHERHAVDEKIPQAMDGIVHAT